jgi:ribosomal protein S18 acetylase RimI-like enzyme
MSLYSRYVEERLGFKTLEVEEGFITYALQPPDCSIEEIYVTPGQRAGPLAKRLTDQVFKIARNAGATKMYLRVIPGTGNAERSLRSVLHYGFKLFSAENGRIILVKDILKDEV